MDKRMQKLLLIFITLALAALPLRGAWSIPNTPATDSESHCAQMQHASQDTLSMADMQHPQDSTGPDRNCQQGCNGSCCNDTCNTCVHGTSIIFGTLTLLPEIPGQLHDEIIPAAFSGQTVKPLLRPPASL
jgi:hypothetical protein